MKQIFSLLTVLMFAFTLNAQYIYNDFDANQNETFSGDPNVPMIIANPDASGVNTSANVAEWVRAADNQWTHVYTILDGMIDFSTGTTFELKVHSPIACEVLFKLEDSNNPATSTEVMGNVTTPNEWQLLTYDFTGAASGTYDKIVIFFDFATFIENTFYFDDVIGPDYIPGSGGGDPVTLPVTFEDENVNYGLTDFGGNISEIVVDPTDETNHVAQSVKTVGAETWAGTTVGGTVGFPTAIPFAEGSTTMTVDVWSPTAGTPIRLKVEASNDVTITCETEVLTTAAMNWETLEFDFSNEAPGTAELNLANSYNKASIFFDFGTAGATEQTYYWDNMDFDGDIPEPKPYLALDVQDNFENDGWGTITDWKLQDSPDLTDLLVVPDPTNPTNNIAAYIRSGTFEWTNAQFILDHRMDLTVRNKFDLTLALPSTNDYSGDLTPTVAMKLQNSLLGADAWTTQTEVKLTVDQFDTWVTLTFDFSEVADREDYDQVVIQFGGEGHLVPGQFSFDDLWLVDESGIFENSLIQMNVYPSPATDVLYLENVQNLNNISIYSVTGQLMYQTDKIGNSIDVNDFPMGMYTIHATGTDGEQFFAKFIVK